MYLATLTRHQAPDLLNQACACCSSPHKVICQLERVPYTFHSLVFFYNQRFFSKKQSRNCLWLATLRESEMLKADQLNQDSWSRGWHIRAGMSGSVSFCNRGFKAHP